MSERIANLQSAIETMHKCKARHVEDKLVVELFSNEVAWDGVVAVFELTGHPRAKRCYAWYFIDEKCENQYTTVLEIPPVDSVETAVKIAIAAEAKSKIKQRKRIGIIVAGAVIAPCLYVGLYAFLIVRIPVFREVPKDLPPELRDQFGSQLMYYVPTYKCGGRVSEIIFRPLQKLDALLFPVKWHPGPEFYE
jgi:hypothetical protein